MSNGGEAADARREREVERKVRKQIKDILLELIDRGINDARDHIKQVPLKGTTPSNKLEMESMACWGLLSNDMMGEKDIINYREAQYVSETTIMYILKTASNKNLFTTFPAVATYTSPFVGSAKVFLEVFTAVEGSYFCRQIDNLRYLELKDKKV